MNIRVSFKAEVHGETTIEVDDDADDSEIERAMQSQIEGGFADSLCVYEFNEWERK